MKKKPLFFIVLALCGAAALAETPNPFAHFYGGPGIALSGTGTYDQLPDSARQFLDDCYQGDSIKYCTRNFVKETSDVHLADGTDITFNKAGQVTYIKSGHDESLSPEVLVNVLPEATVVHLMDAGYSPYVREIRNAQDAEHRIFLLNNPMPEMIFDFNGNFLVTWG